jgi:hypothetical protein
VRIFPRSTEGDDMRANRVFLSFALAIGCGITLQSAAFSQEYRGTWEQQQACTPDVWRLCSAQVPDANSVPQSIRALGDAPGSSKLIAY